MQPDEGDKVGDLTWVSSRQHLQTFNLYPPQAMDTVAAYCHTYLYAKEAGKALFRGGAAHGMKSFTLFVNGKQVAHNPYRWGTTTFDLAKGWNRILVKAVGGGKIEWEHDTGWFADFILLDVPVARSFTSKNIAWMTKLPGGSAAQPIIARDKVFVTTDLADLVCFSKNDGKLLWIRSTTWLDTLSDEDRKAYPEAVAQAQHVAVKLDSARADLIAAINAAVAPDGPTPAQLEAIAKASEAYKGGSGVDAALNKADPKKFHSLNRDQGNGHSNPTPVTDGKYVHFWNATGVAACYDLDGNRKWAVYNEEKDFAHHGYHSSPALVDGVLVTTATKVRGLDAATGKQLWEDPHGWNAWVGILPLHIGDQPGSGAVMMHQNRIHRVSDGKIVQKGFKQSNNCMNTSIIADGVVYTLVQPIFTAHRLPTAMGDTIKSELLWRKPLFEDAKVSEDWPDMARQQNNGYAMCGIASALYHDGLIYYIFTGGYLYVLDAKTGGIVYKRSDVLHPKTWAHGAPGICASPTPGGKAIYMMDNCGYGLVLDPGREYKPLAENFLEAYGSPSSYDQERFEAAPVFEANRLYLRGSEFLYCIQEK